MQIGKLFSTAAVVTLFALAAEPASAQLAATNQALQFQRITSVNISTPAAPAYRIVGTLTDGTIARVDGRFEGGLESNCIDLATTARAMTNAALSLNFRGDINSASYNPATGISTKDYRVVAVSSACSAVAIGARKANGAAKLGFP